jgi:hypothetical protein
MTSLRWRGKTQAELKRVEKEIEENEARKARSLAEALLMQDRSFNSGNTDETSDENKK